jgi:hypothetical protein
LLNIAYLLCFILPCLAMCSTIVHLKNDAQKGRFRILHVGRVTRLRWHSRLLNSSQRSPPGHPISYECTHKRKHPPTAWHIHSPRQHCFHFTFLQRLAGVCFFDCWCGLSRRLSLTRRRTGAHALSHLYAYRPFRRRGRGERSGNLRRTASGRPRE